MDAAEEDEEEEERCVLLCSIAAIVILISTSMLQSAMMWCIFENLLFDQMVIVSSNSCFSAVRREVLVSAFKHYYML